MRIMHVGLFQGKPKKQGAAAMTLQLAVADNPTYVWACVHCVGMCGHVCAHVY